MTRAERAVSLVPSIAALLVFTGALAAGCGGGGGDGDDVDAGVRDAQVGEGGVDAGRRDSGPPVDAMAPPSCEGVTCDAFEYCFEGECASYPPCAGDGTCRAGSTCHSRYCVPDDVDVDGDGSPAGEDCDEADPENSPLLDEICDGDDDDCDTEVDEGDPAAICEYYPGGGVCIDGSCGCPSGTFDLDREVPGCECAAMPDLGLGVTCETAIDLGSFPDSPGLTQVVTGNVLPDDRVVWYRFTATDVADTTCDNFHVRAQLTSNPGDTFEITVSRGSCAAVACPGPVTPTIDYSWATDFRGDVGGVVSGQCPCWAGGTTPSAAAAHCTDDSATFFVRVRRRPGSALSCATYSLEISNGVYDS
ncbi:hypothetical protein [Sandaracinus amylolyticus]|uniref:hypothetical protein n=1 Tax=Sandaracinus amylolyticus TaxID=927083 RepID=UPI001F16C862|nr:hypothetical protein [Sandaracinus amylolyticus]UJR81677.1 Tryptophan synthase alpha chain [Sandaracinus amylolyticus]